MGLLNKIKNFFSDDEEIIEERSNTNIKNSSNDTDDNLNDISFRKKEQSFKFPVVFEDEDFIVDETFVEKPTIVKKEEVKVKREEYKANKTAYKKDEKVFKPSLIISPIHGIMEKNSLDKQETVVEKKDGSKKLDYDSIRENLKTKELKVIKKEDILLNELVENDDEDVDINGLETLFKSLDDTKAEEDELIITNLEKEKTQEKPKTRSQKNSEKNISIEEDTIEYDLFNLIDSMYNEDDDKEGEE